MNRRLLFQISTPALLLGLVLFGGCLITAWYINRLESNLAKILSQNVTSLGAAQELEIRVRQLRNHCFIYLIEPTPAHLEPIEQDNQHFEEALQLARQSAHTPEQHAAVAAIETGYQRYRDELAKLREQVMREGPRTDFGRLSEAHPIRHVTDACHELFRLNQVEMDQTALESKRVTRQANLIVLGLGIGGPIGGLVIGYSMARRLNRSIYRLSVRVQDMARHLDQKVASMSVVVDGNIESLDKQLQHVVGRVEETAQRLQRQQHEMLRAEQLAAVGQLAASVAHEVRNPLTSIKMLVEVAQRAQNRKPLTGEDIDVIHGEIARLEQTVQGFLDFARLPSPQRSICDLRTVVAQAVDLVRARARQQNVDIAVLGNGDGNGAEAPVQGYADVGQMRTVLVNLFLNALDAMPRGGRLAVGLEAAPSAEIHLSVADTGPGIAPELADRLFTPFTSTKPTGTGLGLSISRRIVEEHGGRLSARNRPEGGACFTITLPACPPSADGPSETTNGAAGPVPFVPAEN
jgi:signal transduction histidine kinase